MKSIMSSLTVCEFPLDVNWSTQLYSRVSSEISKLVPVLDGIKYGRSDEWITVWKVSINGNEPDLSSASPCSISADFLSRQYEDVWYYVQVRSEVAEEVSFDHIRCRSGQPKTSDKGDKKTAENNRLLRSLDSQVALNQIDAQRATASQAEADKWHRECLSKDRIINDLEIKIKNITAELEAAIQNQAPMLDDEVAEKLGGRLIDVLQQWATTPTDKGFAAKVLKSILGFMVSIQDDDEVKRLLLLKHKTAFEGVVTSFNEVMTSIGLSDQLRIPELPRAKRLKGKK